MTNLKKRVILDGSLSVSFGGVRNELDDQWSKLEYIKHLISASPQDGSGSSPLFQGRQSSTPMPTSGMLLPSALQVLMRQVVDDLRSSGFVTHDEMEACESLGLDHIVTDQLSGLGKRLTMDERQFTDPDGTLSKIEGRIISLEDRRAGDSRERGGKAFQDIGAVLPGFRPLRTRNFSGIVSTWSCWLCCVLAPMRLMRREWPWLLPLTRLSIIV